VKGDRDRVLDAAKRCCERWGVAKVTVDDIAAESGVSRATLYRLFPGGRDVLYEALRVRETEEFMATSPSTWPARPRSRTWSCGASSAPPACCRPTSTSS
jgi:AcrR family transcriptional regulator